MQFTVATVLFAAGLAAALPQPTPTSAGAAEPTCSPGPVVDYTVVSGDTLTIVSQKLNSGICNIASANGLADPNFILLGQDLKVPTYPCNLDNTSCLAKPSQNLACVAKDSGVAATYTIVSGDSFFLVAQKFNLSVDALTGANEGVDPLLLQVGQVINIPICK